MLTVPKLACRRRKIHHRQRSPGGLEYEVHSRACRLWWHRVQLCLWRRSGLQVYRPRNRLHADEKRGKFFCGILNRTLLTVSARFCCFHGWPVSFGHLGQHICIGNRRHFYFASSFFMHIELSLSVSPLISDLHLFSSCCWLASSRGDGAFQLHRGTFSVQYACCRLAIKTVEREVPVSCVCV